MKLSINKSIQRTGNALSSGRDWLKPGVCALALAALLGLQACGGGSDNPAQQAAAPAPAASSPAASPAASAPAAASSAATPAATPAASAPATAPAASAPASTPTAAQQTQYTPNPADWSTFASKPRAAGLAAHDPDSITWITAAQWKAAEWDGTTIYNPATMSRADFAAAICPSGDRVRGIREVFYKHKPFADNSNPTKAEVDEWHRIAINHVRALVGYTAEDRQVKKDHCMFARASWGDERKFTTRWDTKYPGVLGSAAGPCVGSTNAHCGASFIPDAADQAAYLPAGHAACTETQGAEGVFSASKSNIPWSIKWSRSFCSTVGTEGFWGGHTGPWYHREKVGLSFWDAEASNNNSNAVLRAKWTGNLAPSLYIAP